MAYGRKFQTSASSEYDQADGGSPRLLLVLVIAVLLCAAYLAAGYVAADQFTAPRGIGSRVPAPLPGVTFEPVHFPARTDGMSIAGTWAPRPGAERAVIIVPGMDDIAAAERFNGLATLAAELHKAGFAVMLIDPRGSGDSADSRVTYGVLERRDVLGAADFLVARGFRPGRVGALGIALGAAGAAGAAADDTLIGALATDSLFADVPRFLQDNWARESDLPSFVLPCAIRVSRLLTGIELQDASPANDIARVAPRPVLIMHSAHDRIVPVAHALTIRKAAPAAEYWEVPDAEHAQLYMQYPEEYARRIAALFNRMP